jgi:hypothetical protein
MQLKLKRVKELFEYFLESVKKDGLIKSVYKVAVF